jgi:hypothetical protein
MSDFICDPLEDKTVYIIRSRRPFCASPSCRPRLHLGLQSQISALILTGNRTHQKEQLFSLPFWRKTLRNGLKN